MGVVFDLDVFKVPITRQHPEIRLRCRHPLPFLILRPLEITLVKILKRKRSHALSIPKELLIAWTAPLIIAFIDFSPVQLYPYIVVQKVIFPEEVFMGVGGVQFIFQCFDILYKVFRCLEKLGSCSMGLGISEKQLGCGFLEVVFFLHSGNKTCMKYHDTEPEHKHKYRGKQVEPLCIIKPDLFHRLYVYFFIFLFL